MNRFISRVLILCFGAILLLPIATADGFPFAPGTLDAHGKLQPWSWDDVRMHRDETIGNLAGLTRIWSKDDAANSALLGYASKKEEKQIFEAELDLTGISCLVQIAIQVDDKATLTVEEVRSPETPEGAAIIKNTYTVNGTALWNKQRSYKEFHECLPSGRKYKLHLTYENTANLTDRHPTGFIDHDGVSVFLVTLTAQIVPDDGQTGMTGDLIPSSKGEMGAKHYVSPKKSAEISDDYVVLTAEGVSEAVFNSSLRWLGGEPVPGQPLKRRVARTATGKQLIKIVDKEKGVELDRMHVWIVWCSTIAKPGKGEYEIGDGWSQYKILDNDQDGWLFKYEINPPSIITDLDRPALDGKSRKPVPGEGVPHLLFEGMDADSAEYKWDSSRQLRVTIRNPDLISKELLDMHDSDALWVNQPKELDVVVDFPAKPNAGNDDPLVADEHSIPYVASNVVALKHGVGEMSSHDAPSSVLLDDWGTNDYTLEVDYEFREFVRLELWDGSRNEGRYWFNISDPYEWNVKAKSKFKEPPGDWVDNGSTTGN